jgi:hypothetical protein
VAHRASQYPFRHAEREHGASPDFGRRRDAMTRVAIPAIVIRAVEPSSSAQSSSWQQVAINIATRAPRGRTSAARPLCGTARRPMLIARRNDLNEEER